MKIPAPRYLGRSATQGRLKEITMSIVSSPPHPFHEHSVGELRRLVRERGLANGTAVACARREQLVALLDGTSSAADLFASAGTQTDADASTSSTDAGTPTADAPRRLLSAVSRSASVADTSIGNMLASMARDAIDAEITSRASELRPIVNINLGDARHIELPTDAHPALADCIALAHAGLPILLVGPAGSGKTHLSGQIASALGRLFTFNSLSAGVTESHILGRILPDSSGNWSYQPTPFVHAYRAGGVHLFDEIDAADANLLVTLNAALANGHLSVPFAQIEPIARHPDFVFIAAANTFGRGADRQYVGRNALDAATLDRFSVSTVFVDYDRALERRIASAICGDDSASMLLAWAHEVRDSIERNKLRRIMSTRTIKNAATLLGIGRTLQSIQDTYFNGWSADERAKAGC